MGMHEAIGLIGHCCTYMPALVEAAAQSRPTSYTIVPFRCVFVGAAWKYVSQMPWKIDIFRIGFQIHGI